jgi:hypothetical protein
LWICPQAERFPEQMYYAFTSPPAVGEWFCNGMAADVSEDEVKDWLHFTTRLNDRCEELIRPKPEITEG